MSGSGKKSGTIEAFVFIAVDTDGYVWGYVDSDLGRAKDTVENEMDYSAKVYSKIIKVILPKANPESNVVDAVIDMSRDSESDVCR